MFINIQSYMLDTCENICSCLFASDGSQSKSKAWNYALRYHQRTCANYLLSKCFGKIQIGTGINAKQISITVRIRKMHGIASFKAFRWR